MHLNDSSEFVHSNRMLKAEITQRLRDNLSGLHPDWGSLLSEIEAQGDEWHYRTSTPFVASFCENGDQLSQWRSYCPAGDGFSIGFSHSDLAHLMKVTGFRLVKCIYGSGEHSALVHRSMMYMDRVRRRKPGPGEFFGSLGLFLRAAAKTSTSLAAIKHEGFVEEKEWRLVGDPDTYAPLRHRPGRFGILPYCELPLCADGTALSLQHIIVGPNDQPKVAKAAVLTMMQTVCGDIDPNRVSISKIPFRY